MSTAAEFIAHQKSLGKIPNRLLNEKSPYLLQHAFNPVDWYPWGNEAFAKARRENKPVFLSIGYSTCYWCHVMEREVFENESIAALMNEHLVSIKVDREERPDIDRIYMTAVQALTGSGGWPMSVFLSADRKPFFGGTYFPPTDAYGRPGFPTLVRRIKELWESDREKIIRSGEEIAAQLQNFSRSAAITSAMPREASLEKGFHQFRQAFDEVYGGFGGAPKFPRPVAFNFLFRYYARTGDDAALQITLSTLRKMAEGGVCDHLGGGFHRYSVDEQWRVPHFEKMLYDQAQLACSYLDAFQITRDEFYSGVARDILAYIKRVFAGPQGGLYSAEDAESAFTHDNPEEKEEGAFYVWESDEIDRALSEDQAAIFKYHYGVTKGGNALRDPQRVFINKNILYVAHTLDETAGIFRKTHDQITQILAECRKVLFSAREQKPKPHLDDKIITAWNGLAISAFARAAQVLDDREALAYAERAARFILENLSDTQTGTLLRRYRDGEARFDGTLQDYAFFVQGLIDLYEASFNIEWLKTAAALTTKQIALFGDAEDGGFFDTPPGNPELIFTTKEDYDSAEPTGNAVAALNLLRLAQATDNKEWRVLGERTILSFGARLERMPEVVPQMLCALEWTVGPVKEVIISGTPGAEDTAALTRAVHSYFVPDKVLLYAGTDDTRNQLSSYLPFIKGLHPKDGKATAFVCENYSCNLPTTDPALLNRLLAQHPPKE